MASRADAGSEREPTSGNLGQVSPEVSQPLPWPRACVGRELESGIRAGNAELELGRDSRRSNTGWEGLNGASPVAYP